MEPVLHEQVAEGVQHVFNAIKKVSTAADHKRCSPRVHAAGIVEVVAPLLLLLFVCQGQVAGPQLDQLLQETCIEDPQQQAYLQTVRMIAMAHSCQPTLHT